MYDTPLRLERQSLKVGAIPSRGRYDTLSRQVRHSLKGKAGARIERNGGAARVTMKIIYHRRRVTFLSNVRVRDVRNANTRKTDVKMRDAGPGDMAW